MAEAILIFSLAANVVQFLDIGSKFVSSVWKIYRSGRNGLDEIPDLATITDDLRMISQGLQAPDGDDKEIVDGGQGLKELAGQCQSVVMELLDSLNKISCQTVESVLIYPNNVLLSARVLLVFSQLF